MSKINTSFIVIEKNTKKRSAQFFLVLLVSVSILRAPSFALDANSGAVTRLDQQKPADAEDKLNGGPDTELLDRMEQISQAYRRRGRYSYAEAILQDVFEIRQKKKGLDDPEMAYYHNDLGLLQAEQAKYFEAEAHYLRAIAITEKQ